MKIPRPATSASDEDCIEYVTRWIHLLISAGIEAALAQLDPQHQAKGFQFTPEHWRIELEYE